MDLGGMMILLLLNLVVGVVVVLMVAKPGNMAKKFGATSKVALCT